MEDGSDSIRQGLRIWAHASLLPLSREKRCIGILGWLLEIHKDFNLWYLRQRRCEVRQSLSRFRASIRVIDLDDEGWLLLAKNDT